MTVKQLIEELSKLNPEADVILPANNGLVNTYSLCDYKLNTSYEYLSCDFFGTPGKVDDRVFFKDSGDVVYLGSYFPCRFYTDFDDTPLKSIKEAWWEQYGFKYNNETFSWVANYSKTKHITYSNRTDDISVINWDDYKQYRSQNPTLSEFYKVLSLCNLYEQFNNSYKRKRINT